MGVEPKVGFSKLESNDKEMHIHQDSTHGVLGVSYEDSLRWKQKAFKARIGIAILTIVLTALIVILLLVLELQLHCPKSTDSLVKHSHGSTVKFALFSDYHYDLYYDNGVSDKPTSCRKLGGYVNASYTAPYGRIGCDSPPALVHNMLDAVKKEEGLSFVLMTGDFSAHKMDKSYFDKTTTPAQHTLKNIILSSNQTKTAFPNIPIFPMLGNNDLPGHYVLPVNADWYSSTLRSFAPLILCEGCPGDVPRPTSLDILKKTFLDGGYYSVNVTGTNGRMMLLILNTLYWNVYANELSKGNPVIQDVAKRQMTWLEDQLDHAVQMRQKVFIASHIPPGIDPFDGATFWLSNYTNMYVNLVAGKYKDVVAGQFYAHIHKDDFHLQVLETESRGLMDSQAPYNKSFVLLIPSVSPIYANNPAYRIGYIDVDKQALLDYDQYYLDLVIATQFKSPAWQFSYKFSDLYPSSNYRYIDADRIYELNQGLINTTSDKTWRNYVFSRTLYYQSGSYSRFSLYCAMRYVFNDNYQSCIHKYYVPGG